MARRRTPATLPADPDAARTALLAAAEERFERYGFRRVTMDEIAEAAGVSRPTLYRYFGDRESLISSIVERRANRLVSRVHRRIDKAQSIADKLIAGLLFLVDVGRKDEFIREMLESTRAAGELLAQKSIATTFAEAVWSPTFGAAKTAGVLPNDFDEQLACRWLTSINFMLIEWSDYDELPVTYKQGLIRQFVAPAFVRPA